MQRRSQSVTAPLLRSVSLLPHSMLPHPAQAKLLEHNVRFGDPECQSLMVRLQSDLLESLQAQVRGEDVKLQWSADPSLTVVLAAKGYPGPYAKGGHIRNLEAVQVGAGGRVDGWAAWAARRAAPAAASPGILRRCSTRAPAPTWLRREPRCSMLARH